MLPQVRPSMFRAIFICSLLVLRAAAYGQGTLPEDVWVARHRREDREWARKNGLSLSEARRLRLMAGVPDDSADYVDTVDASSLRRRGQVLVVSAGGNGHCLCLHVFSRRGGRLKRVWSAEGAPDGAGFCRASPTNPSAYVNARKDIVVKIPVFDYKRRVNIGSDLYTFKWNGRTYRYGGVRSAR